MPKPSDPITIDRLWTKADVAERLSVSIRAIERYIALRQMPQPIRLGGRGAMRWRREVIENWLAKREREAETNA